MRQQIITRFLSRNFPESKPSVLQIREHELLGHCAALRKEGVARAAQRLVGAPHERDVPDVGDGWTINQRIDIERPCESPAQMIEPFARAGRNAYGLSEVVGAPRSGQIGFIYDYKSIVSVS